MKFLFVQTVRARRVRTATRSAINMPDPRLDVHNSLADNLGLERRCITKFPRVRGGGRRLALRSLCELLFVVEKPQAREDQLSY
jgi:hypothetical protein